MFYHVKPEPVQTTTQWEQKENKVNIIWHDISAKMRASSHFKYAYGPKGIDLYCRPQNEDWDEQRGGKTAQNHQDYDILFDIDEKGLTDAEKQL